MMRRSPWTGLFATLGLVSASLAIWMMGCSETAEVDLLDPLPDAAPDTNLAADVGPKEDAGCDGDACADEGPCGGAAWCPVDSGLTGRFGFLNVWGSSPEDVWVVGNQGRVLHWDGATWTATALDTEGALFNVRGRGPQEIWISSTPSLVACSTGFEPDRAGVVETASFASILGTDRRRHHMALGALWVSPLGEVWVGASGSGTTTGGLWRSAVVDGGAGWRAAAPLRVNAIWGSGQGDVWIVGPLTSSPHGSMSSRTDGTVDGTGALTWTSLDAQSDYALHGLWGSSPKDVWAVGAFGTIRHFGPNDERWRIVEVPTKKTLRAVWGSSPTDIWAVGDEATIVHYDGTSWSLSTVALAPGIVPDFRGVWGSGADDVWAVGGDVIVRLAGRTP